MDKTSFFYLLWHFHLISRIKEMTRMSSSENWSNNKSMDLIKGRISGSTIVYDCFKEENM